MEHHGILRIREQSLEDLKAMVDDRTQWMRLRNKVASQLRAFEARTDHISEDTKAALGEQLDSVQLRLEAASKRVEHAVKELAKVDPLAKAALSVPGVGPIIVAYCRVYIDLTGRFPAQGWDGKPHPRAGEEKCEHASSLWKYVGIDVSSHERYEKGRAGGGNKTLRTVLYTFADVQVKMNGEPDKNGRTRVKGAYHDLYEPYRAKLEVSDRLVKTRNTQGNLVECAWKDTKPSHRHGAAMRYIIKHFLADYWFVGRTLLGLPTTSVYIVWKEPGQHHMISPKSRGWVYQGPGSEADEKAQGQADQSASDQKVREIPPEAAPGEKAA